MQDMVRTIKADGYGKKDPGDTGERIVKLKTESLARLQSEERRKWVLEGRRRFLTEPFARASEYKDWYMRMSQNECRCTLCTIRYAFGR